MRKYQQNQLLVLLMIIVQVTRLALMFGNVQSVFTVANVTLLIVVMIIIIVFFVPGWDPKRIPTIVTAIMGELSKIIEGTFDDGDGDDDDLNDQFPDNL